MDKLFRMIYLYFISSSFSCVEKKTTEKEINKSEIVRTSQTDTLKFTLNCISLSRQVITGWKS
jgi:hypothetical protein